LKQSAKLQTGGLVFGYRVNDPQRYGVIEFDRDGMAISLEEKPNQPKSNYAVPGLYFYDHSVCEYAANLKPSARGELEITDLNLVYLQQKKLRVEILGRGYAWLDTGTHESLHQAANFIQTLEQRQGLKLACVEEIAYGQGYIDQAQLGKLAAPLAKSSYGQYLENVLRQDSFEIGIG
jgi:glucose-1-phosphate thymidylyltransferase